ncbi:MAG TPA: type II toxin-antitoxin system Phd/YefM family antitoxin [Micropepsaceae bacterium]|nr:type II toxin-antitoxin system Phd/YefM family antitoxin [Micropepsaceae bacterium]
MKIVTISKLRVNLCRFLHGPGKEEIIITRHGKPAGVLIGFETDDDWFDYRLEHDP